MFGKIFASTFDGSMLGAGSDIFAVWAWVIANAVNSRLEINPALVGYKLGIGVERVKVALEYLQQPDPASRNPEHGGRRLVKEEGQYSYLVVSHRKYRNIRSAEEQRQYNARKQREYRERKKAAKTAREAAYEEAGKRGDVVEQDRIVETSYRGDIVEEIRRNGPGVAPEASSTKVGHPAGNGGNSTVSSGGAPNLAGGGEEEVPSAIVTKGQRVPMQAANKGEKEERRV